MEEIAMKFTLESRKDEGRMIIRAGKGYTWSLLTPECIYCREFAEIHVHTRRPRWKKIKGGWKIEHRFPDENLACEGTITPADAHSVELVFTIENQRSRRMTDTVADFCFSVGGGLSTHPDTIDQSNVNTAFSGPLRERNTDWTRRTLVPTQSGLAVVGDINFHFPVALNRQMAGTNVADLPIILCQSVDYKETYAAGWECCHSLSCAIGYCIHTQVHFGTIPAGESSTRRGRFYYMKADPYKVLQKFQHDFTM
jgi:hypothetical protein